MFNGNGGWGDFNGNGGSGESNGNGGCGGFNGGAVSDEEEEEAQDSEVFQEPWNFDDLEPFWVNGDVEAMWNLFDMNEIKEIQQIIGNRNHLALHQMEDQVNHLGQAQIVHNVDHFVLPQLENNGGLQPMLQNIEEQLYMEDDPGLLQITGLQQPQHVVHGSMDNLVNLEWLDILTSVGIHEPEPSGGSLAYNGVNVDFNGLGESDEDEQAAHFGEVAELEPEALEDLGPYWVDDVDNGQEQWNLLNMDPPPDEFFDGVDNEILFKLVV